MFPFDGGLNGDNFDPYDKDDRSPGYANNYEQRPFIKDELYYHHQVDVKVVHESNKAYLMKDEHGEYWIPKALILCIKTPYDGNGSWYQWDKFNVNYLEDRQNGFVYS